MKIQSLSQLQELSISNRSAQCGQCRGRWFEGSGEYLRIREFGLCAKCVADTTNNSTIITEKE